MVDGGTIFLDEIGDISPRMQAALLRVLQDGEIIRVGGNTPLTIDVRVIAATNKDLAAMVQDGSFRLDLFYRLNIINISIPPLRERRDDINDLVTHFIRRYRQAFKKEISFFPQSILNRLIQHDWPGNVRELENVVERTITLSEGNVIEIADLPTDFGQTDSDSRESAGACPKITEQGIDMPQFVAGIERTLIHSALALTNGVKARAADLLNIKRTTLVEKIKRLKIEA